MTFSPKALGWLAHALNANPKVLTSQRMKGSTTSSIYLIQSNLDTNAQHYVLRVIDNPDWLAEEPGLVEHEAAVLEKVQACRLRGPRLVAQSVKDVGFGAPVVLMTFMEGKIDLRPANMAEWLKELARELAAIHRCPVDDFKWHFKSWVDTSALTVPDWTTKPKLWERAIDLFNQGAPESRPVFLHRDYHPMNVLWNEGTISGVVDWVNACQGSASVDLAHCRMNLVTMYGIEVAEEFLAHYCELVGGFEHHPYWDIDSILNWCLPQPGFYSPWLDFGLEPMTQETLNQRMDAYLERVMIGTKL